jgi:hypothetical protein
MRGAVTAEGGLLGGDANALKLASVMCALCAADLVTCCLYFKDAIFLMHSANCSLHQRQGVISVYLMLGAVSRAS